MTISLIISTYNRPDALRLCLLSVFAQSRMPDEIIIGDDGSREETRQLIESMRQLTKIPILHIWQEDIGYRLAMARNKCVAAASGEYIIEIDGDLVLHKHFVKDHDNLARRGFYLRGGRANLNQTLTNDLCSAGILPKLGFFTRGFENKRENSLHIPALARFLAPRYRKGRAPGLGCNMSFFRDDFIRVNGYDEFFEGYGGEDSDLARRLQLAGIKKRHLKFAGNVFHLWHNDHSMYNFDRNVNYFRRANPEIFCTRGVNQYL